MTHDVIAGAPRKFLCIGTFTPVDVNTLDAVIEVKESLAGEFLNPKFAYVRFGIEYNGQAHEPPSPPDEQGVMRCPDE